MIDRRKFLGSSLVAGVTSVCISPRVYAEEPADAKSKSTVVPLGYQLTLDTAAKLFDGKQSYAHPRAGIVPGAGVDGNPRVVLTVNTVDTAGSDVFRTMNGLETDDLGKTWSEPKKIPNLSYRMETIDGVERPVAYSDSWPTWHNKSKTLLSTGHTVAYTSNWKVVPKRPRDTAYSYYNPADRTWAPWMKLQMHDARKFEFAGAGCTQRYDLPDGTILLPMYFRPPSNDKKKLATVMRCSFDGRTLKYLDHGDELSIPNGGSGLGECSLAFFDGSYYLTLRQAEHGYVARSADGLHYEPVRPWTFDDGSDLGNYETQQHWVTHSDGLFLVYTRRGANNDHVFRHRAPLFIGQVDPKRLVVLRATERELLPNRGARYGNFGVTNVNRDETWITDSEWMQPEGVEKYGSDGSLFVARIHWSRPNRIAI